jgi:hypothetical protein
MLVFMPVIFMVFYIINYGVNIPCMDEWDTPGIDFVKLAQNDLDFQTLFRQHNESRKFFPRIIFIFFAQFGGWNTKHGMFLSLAAACISYWNVYKLVRYTTGWSMTSVKWLAILCMGLLIFSPAQRENWLSGIQLITFIPVLAITTCIILAYSSIKPLSKFFAAAALCVFATFSFSNGILTWIIVLPILLWSEHKVAESLLRTLKFLLGWILCFSLTTWIYFRDYSKPDELPSYQYAFAHPTETFSYFLSFIGAPLGKWLDVEGRVIIGLIFLGVYISLVVLCFRGKRSIFFQVLDATIGWQTLGFYSILSALIASFGRVGNGLDTSLSGRYVTFATPLYVAILGLLIVLYSLDKTPYSSSDNKYYSTLPRNVWKSVFILLVFCLYTLSIIPGIRWGYVSKLDRLYSKSCLMFSTSILDTACLQKYSYPDFEVPVNRLPTLQESGTLHLHMMDTDILNGIAQGESIEGEFSQLRVVENAEATQVIDQLSITNNPNSTNTYVASGWISSLERDIEIDSIIIAHSDSETQANRGFKIAGLTPKFDSSALLNSVDVSYGSNRERNPT